MELHLSDSAMQLAILKLLAENNGMLKAALKSLADIQSSMVLVNIPDSKLDEIRDNMFQVFQNLSSAYSDVAMQQAIDYANSNDPNSDLPEGLLKP